MRPAPSRRRVWLWRALLLLAAALAAALVSARGLGAASALVLVVVVAVGLAAGPLEGAVAGVVGGWFGDLVPPGGELLGVAALTHAAAGYLAGRATRVAGWPLWWPGAVAAAGWAVVSAVPVLRALTSGAPVAWAGLAGQLLVTALLAALLVPALLVVDRRLAARRAR
ncbi:rod shape-determining protein MreD [Janibacter sp. YIM B02568]|uniref:rod shape-determining protein MreD n=1 Tax=Janibacter endophyticus TaxID=2806261 RepID=UPI001950596C|nr:rod shape-determining protein MreD [Janibacter endophyticus]MBM6546759.1 rod shape-determining protein MreD [Janibacter endophyticus]